MANTEAANHAATVVPATATIVSVATMAVKATRNMFKAKNVKFQLPGKFGGHPSKL